MFKEHTEEILDGLQKPTYEVKSVPEEPMTITKLREIALDCYNKISAIPVNAVENTKEYSEFVIAVKNFAKAEKEYLEKEPSGVDGDVDEEIRVVLCKYGCIVGDCEMDKPECNREFKQTLDKLYRRKLSREIRRDTLQEVSDLIKGSVCEKCPIAEGEAIKNALLRVTKSALKEAEEGKA